MKISCVKYCLFSEVEVNQCFSVGCDFYLKIQPITTENGKIANSVYLDLGMMTHFDNSDVVTPHPNAELVIKN